jgi:hypothetical protein
MTAARNLDHHRKMLLETGRRLRKLGWSFADILSTLTVVDSGLSSPEDLRPIAETVAQNLPSPRHARRLQHQAEQEAAGAIPSELHEAEAPAFLSLSFNRRQFSWVVPECPFCWLRHFHGGGLVGGDPRACLSWRTAHCLNRPLGTWTYRLKDLSPERTAEILSGLAAKRGGPDVR